LKGARPAGGHDAVRGVAPRLVVEPADAREVADALKSANDEGLAVIPRGGGTKLAWGHPPRRADVVLSTARLNRIVEHAWADLTVTVEAGCTVRVLQDALGAHGQRIAADPLWPDAATIAGALSANDTGALRLRFGGWRDLVIGTTLALPDGTLASSGGKVVKNVAGYDLSKLATGAFGTLGVITTAIFRLHPLPQRAQTLSAPVPDADRMQRLIGRLLDSQLALTSVQVRASASGPIVVDVLVEGTAAGVDAQMHDLRTLADGVRFDAGEAAVWEQRQDLWTGPDGPILKISVLVTEWAGTLALIRRLAAAARVEWRAVWQATGVGCVRFIGRPADWPALVRDLRAPIERQGGSVTILRPLADDDACDPWGGIGDAHALMAAVKAQFDPKGTLNPGRFVGGI
jgi:glycolate oxidase FAD binding subunit